jgi:hypothetical protein
MMTQQLRESVTHDLTNEDTTQNLGQIDFLVVIIYRGIISLYSRTCIETSVVATPWL